MKTHLNLDECSGFSALQRAAQTAPMLNHSENMTADRISRFHLRAADLDISYATERIDSKILDLLQGVADEQGVIGQFEALAEGEPMNFISGTAPPRPALHLWNRHFEPNGDDVPSETAVSKAMVRRELDRIEAFLAGIEQARIVNEAGTPFRHLVQIGIGGSELGPKAVCRGLQGYARSDRQVSTISNIDPDHVDEVLRSVDLAETLFAVASKSGSTLETHQNALAVQARLEAAGLSPREHLVSITTRGSALDDEGRFRERFFMLSDVGGRFSVTSPVGMLSLGFVCGMDVVKAFLAGAAAMDESAIQSRVTENPALLLAVLSVWNRNFLGIPTHGFLPYCDLLDEFIGHLQQLEMESNGKSVSRDGRPVSYATAPVLWGACGTNAQHSFFQQLHQGQLITSCTFLGFRRASARTDAEAWMAMSHHHLIANMIAQSVSLAQGQDDANPNRRFVGNRPSHVIVGDRLDPRSLGSVLALFENKTVMEGFLWNINSFDQEGVQLGKALAGALAQDEPSKPPLPGSTRDTGRRLMAQFRF